MIRIFFCLYIIFSTLLLAADGICYGNHPSFNHDGKKILYDFHGKIYTIDLISKSIRLICDSVEASNAKWSPNGKRIVFQGIQNKDQLNVSSIWIIDEDKTHLIELFRSTNEINHNPSFSRDGKSIAWSRGNQIWVARANGENPHPLKNIDQPNEAYFQDWSPDGKTIMFLTITDTLSTTVWLYDINSQHLKPLSTKMDFLSARWFKDTSHIALLTSYGIVLLDMNELNDQYLLYSGFGIGSYDISRDGKSIVYELQDPEYDSTIMIDKLTSEGK